MTRTHSQTHSLKVPPTSKHQHFEDRSLPHLGGISATNYIWHELLPQSRGFQRPAFFGACRGEKKLDPHVSIAPPHYGECKTFFTQTWLRSPDRFKVFHMRQSEGKSLGIPWSLLTPFVLLLSSCYVVTKSSPPHTSDTITFCQVYKAM